MNGFLLRVQPDYRDQQVSFPEVEVVIFEERFLADRRRFATVSGLECVDAVCRGRALHLIYFQLDRFPVYIQVLCTQNLRESLLVVDVSSAVDHRKELIAAIVLRRVA